MSTRITPTSKDVTIRTMATGYQVTIKGYVGKAAVYTDTASMLADITAYFNNPAQVPWAVTDTTTPPAAGSTASTARAPDATPSTATPAPVAGSTT